MFDLLLRRARLTDDTLTDIAIQDGKIAAVGDIAAPAQKTVELNGEVFVSAGWIDSHVHCYPNSPIYHDEPDSVGIATGVTSVVDAGSTGADDVDDFYNITRKASTEVFALLNISRVGLIAQNELANMANIDAGAVKQAVQRHPNFIVGLKARMSSSVVGENGITPLERAKAIQKENGDLPLMVHIGNNPPNLDEIADLLSSGDIITHCYNGKPNRILTPSGELRASVTSALKRGVRLDVGHGTASFSFEVAKRAIAMGILPHTISSDIYCRNRINGPVGSLASVMSKFLAIGMSLPQVIECVTANAADGLRLAHKGRIQPGLDADLTLFTIKRQPTVLTDAENDSLQAEHILVPLAAIRAGKGYMTEQGSTEHAFNFEKYNLKQVINTSGRMTALGVSTPRPEVVQAAMDGMNQYFEMKDLVNKTGEYIAKLLDVEGATVVSCASAGIAQSVAAVLVKDSDWLLENLHVTPIENNEIVLPKGHNVNFGAPVGTMVALGGGRLVEAGYANECSADQLAAAITPRTAAILYIKSHHCVQKSMLSVEQAAVVARKHDLPLIVDAAAEEDLHAYYRSGADLVIYSGAKAIEGPTSGLVIGRTRYVEWVKRQTAGIGRAMKVGKEGILGLTCAIEHYLTATKESGDEMVAKMTPFIDALNTLNGVTARVVWDSAGRDIARTEIKFDEATTGVGTGDLVHALKQGEYAIYFRGYKANEGIIEADVRSVSAEQLNIVYRRISEVLGQEKKA